MSTVCQTIAMGDVGSCDEPGFGVVLRVFQLVLSDDVRILVEDEETSRAEEWGSQDGQTTHLHSAVDCAGKTYVVPQSREPTNSPCLRLAMVVVKRMEESERGEYGGRRGGGARI